MYPTSTSQREMANGMERREGGRGKEDVPEWRSGENLAAETGGGDLDIHVNVRREKVNFDGRVDKRVCTLKYMYTAQ